MTLEQSEQTIDATQYTDNADMWGLDSETFTIGANGHVDGVVHIFDRDNHVDVSASVLSYEYERNNELRINYVPLVTVARPDGTIIDEPYARDSRTPETAIERAIRTAEWAYDEHT
jgi:hypothetical protein